MVTKEVMGRIVKSCRSAKRATDEMRPIHENGGVCDEIYGDLTDALYILLGEQTDTLDESITYTVLNSNMSDEECANVLQTIYEHRQQYAGQPAPCFFREGENTAVGYKYEGA